MHLQFIDRLSGQFSVNPQKIVTDIGSEFGVCCFPPPSLSFLYFEPVLQKKGLGRVAGLAEQV